MRAEDMRTRAVHAAHARRHGPHVRDDDVDVCAQRRGGGRLAGHGTRPIFTRPVFIALFDPIFMSLYMALLPPAHTYIHLYNLACTRAGERIRWHV